MASKWELHSYFKRYFSYLKEKKKNTTQRRSLHNYFTLGFPLHLATLEFFLFICNEKEPFLTFFQGERPLAIFLYEKLKELLLSIMGRFIRLAVFAVSSSTRKMLKIDLKKEEKLISSDNLHLGVGTTRAVNKCTTTQALKS